MTYLNSVKQLTVIVFQVEVNIIFLLNCNTLAIKYLCNVVVGCTVSFGRVWQHRGRLLRPPVGVGAGVRTQCGCACAGRHLGAGYITALGRAGAVAPPRPPPPPQGSALASMSAGHAPPAADAAGCRRGRPPGAASDQPVAERVRRDRRAPRATRARPGPVRAAARRARARPARHSPAALPRARALRGARARSPGARAGRRRALRASPARPYRRGRYGRQSLQGSGLHPGALRLRSALLRHTHLRGLPG